MNDFDFVPFANFFFAVVFPVCSAKLAISYESGSRGALPKRGLCSLHGCDHCLKAGWLKPGAGQRPDLRGKSGLGIIVG